MSRPTTMGPDLTRGQFLAGLEEVGRAVSGEETSVVIMEN